MGSCGRSAATSGIRPLSSAVARNRRIGPHVSMERPVTTTESGSESAASELSFCTISCCSIFFPDCFFTVSDLAGATISRWWSATTAPGAASWLSRTCMVWSAPKSLDCSVRSPARRRKMRSRSLSIRRRRCLWCRRKRRRYLRWWWRDGPGGNASRKVEAEVYRISLFGFLGPNRRLPVLLRALANFAQRDRFQMDIYGTIDGAEKIQQLICRLGLSDQVTMHGFVRQDELDEALRRTDLVVNLRNPSMGEASGSQLHLWQYALPSLVTRSAWYETLPENTVGFVRPEHEPEDIQAHLAAFLDDPEKYRELGRNGRERAARNHSMETYASSLLEVASRAPEFRSRWIARDLARRAASAMGWCDSSTIDFPSALAEQLEKLAPGNRVAHLTASWPRQLSPKAFNCVERHAFNTHASRRRCLPEWEALKIARGTPPPAAKSWLQKPGPRRLPRPTSSPPCRAHQLRLSRNAASHKASSKWRGLSELRTAGKPDAFRTPDSLGRMAIRSTCVLPTLRRPGAELAATRRPKAERIQHLLDEQRVCIRQLSLQASEEAVLADRARRATELKLEELARRVPSPPA